MPVGAGLHQTGVCHIGFCIYLNISYFLEGQRQACRSFAISRIFQRGTFLEIC